MDWFIVSDLILGALIVLAFCTSSWILGRWSATDDYFPEKFCQCPECGDNLEKQGVDFKTEHAHSVKLYQCSKCGKHSRWVFDEKDPLMIS